jgi:HK97 gp10 family phage protein
MADVEVEFIDNSGTILREMVAKKAKALEMVGLAAEGYAKRLCAVDTGRLRNSITHTTGTGNSGLPDPPARPEDSALKGTPEKDTVYIGTNVEYAPYVELGTVRTPAQPFLRPAAADHTPQYKEILEKVMKDQL